MDARLVTILAIATSSPCALAAAPAAGGTGATKVSYEAAFGDLYRVLGRRYRCFAMKGIDWAAVGRELSPRARQVETDEAFGLLCMELVARLQDSHAHLLAGKAKLPSVAFPRWDPGFACLVDDRGKPVVHYVDRSGPARAAGLRVGMTVVAVNGVPADEAMAALMRRMSRIHGYSSRRYLQYHAAQWLGRQMDKGATVALTVEGLDGRTRTLHAPATLGVRYLPRLPVPIPGIRDSGDVSWKRLDRDIGYIYVRRERRDLVGRLDRAVGSLHDARALIIDVRGNSGGGFDGRRAWRNFDLDDGAEPERPRFGGPIALLIDSRCISAGEGWASWFVARRRARLFGTATAGASAKRTTYELTNGLYKVTFPIRPRRGCLNRPIEHRGLEPDVTVRVNAKDLAEGRDTVLETAKAWLLERVAAPASAASQP